MDQIILASESPRRKEIMELMDIPYKVITSNVKEEVPETIPDEMVRALAKLKSHATQAKMQENDDFLEQSYLIIGADTMVFYKEHALGKPQTIDDAARMLTMLSDDVHEVYTGVSIIIHEKNKPEEEVSFAVCTKVVVQPMSSEQIMNYIATGEPMDKAGSYAIQGRFGIYIKEIMGDYYNVVGFPIAKIYDTLLQKGIDIKKLK